MKKYLLALVLTAALAPGQWKQPSDNEKNDLQQALGEAGSSPVEFIRALEKHLEKYPASTQRGEIEKALAKAALEARDDARTLKYGQKQLDAGVDDPQLLERVSRLLLDNSDKASNEKALDYAKRFEALMRNLQKQGLSSQRNRAEMLDELDRALGRAVIFQARATGNLGKMDEALQLSRKSYQQYPSSEAAREIGRWLVKSGKETEAIDFYADAFALEDSRATRADRARDRAKLSELWGKTHDSEQGLGDVILKAYDRTSVVLSARAANAKEQDPNATANEVMNFTLASVNGKTLPLTELKGKVVVFDFWATWCGPCRVQHPLYEQVKKHFAANKDVLFLNVATDEDQTVVRPFLAAQKWPEESVYYDTGLGDFLKVQSIPTTVILGRDGQVTSRLNGFLPDRFVAMLIERIDDALKAPARTTAASMARPE